MRTTSWVDLFATCFTRASTKAREEISRRTFLPQFWTRELATVSAKRTTLPVTVICELVCFHIADVVSYEHSYIDVLMGYSTRQDLDCFTSLSFASGKCSGIVNN